MGVLAQMASEGATDRARHGAERAADLPLFLQDILKMLLPVLQGRIRDGVTTPFVETPEAPRLSLSPTEMDLTGLSQGLARNVGVRPIEEAFGAARGIVGRPTDLASITAEVSPGLSPAIQQIIERERGGRMQLGEELTSQGAYLGSPLIEGQRRLAEGTNRDIAATVADAVMRERGLRGQEQQGALGELRAQGGLAPTLAQQLGALPRELGTQQFGLERQAAEDRERALQQVFNLLMGGAGTGANIYGTRARTLLGGEQIAADILREEMAGMFNLTASGIGAAGKCWVAAALYGTGSPEFFAAREWIFRRWQGPLAAVVRWLYLRIGPALAWLVRRSPTVRALVKPFFDWTVRQCHVARLAEA